MENYLKKMLLMWKTGSNLFLEIVFHHLRNSCHDDENYKSQKRRTVEVGGQWKALT